MRIYRGSREYDKVLRDMVLSIATDSGFFGRLVAKKTITSYNESVWCDLLHGFTDNAIGINFSNGYFIGPFRKRCPELGKLFDSFQARE